ncbi:MAG TPA: NAD(P)H-dependent oxidoreductase subunit E [Candidatus Brocadiia bacterium]|nr:NAD(P)H-dependent oxidoreductase subunit E [Candidatus Brocadiia bacterium]
MSAGAPTKTTATSGRSDFNGSGELDLCIVDRIVSDIGGRKCDAIPILQAIQKEFRYLPGEALKRVCEISEITPAQIAGVSTFYSQFRHLPMGAHLVSVCHGTACHVAGAEAVTESVRRHLGLGDDTDTDSDRIFTVQKVGCLGCCSIAPVMQIDDRTYGYLSRENAPRVLEKFLKELKTGGDGRRAGKTALARHKAQEIRISLVSCCVASGALDIRKAAERAADRMGAPACFKESGCMGMCHLAPIMEIVEPDGSLERFANLTPDAAAAIVQKRLKPGGPGGRLRAALQRAGDLLNDDASWEKPEDYVHSSDGPGACAFLSGQRHIALEGSGRMSPLSLEDYEAHDGYKALRKAALEMRPEDIIEAVRRSGLRGRGGAGYPTGAKWAEVRRQPGGRKLIVMNGDEGDPGAFMDHMLLESYPHRVIEGIAIAAKAVGAVEGWLYIRAEYPLAVVRMREAMKQAEDAGYLGRGICGSDFSLELKLVEGAGAFVCGEETALITSIQGGRGMPRMRPPYPAVSGLWGLPTNINNVETYAVVPWIIRNGPDAFAAIGTPGSRGTKVFALAGKIVRSGLIEVPMGTTIRRIVEEIGGGIKDGRAVKSVQIGGPSGGCLPASMCDVPVDYDALQETGAIMGSGGLVVMDDSACMVDVARYFLNFTQGESCGKCTFCRIGTRRMLEILERLCAGEGRKRDIEQLEELALKVKNTSLCGLGRTAPNPVLTTLRFFHDEYEAHAAGRCPAKRCRALIRYSISDKCIGCTICAQRCQAGAIEMRPYERHEIDQTKCVKCGTCGTVCPAHAVNVE